MRVHLLATVLFSLAGLSPVNSQSFVETAAGLGITGGYGQPFINLAAGVSFADFNNDGWDDLTFCTNNGQALKIFQNDSGTYNLVTLDGITGVNEKKTVVWVDYDNDGDQDLYVVFKPSPCKLFRNNGDMTFTDYTAAAGLPNPPFIPENWSCGHGASFCDYDRDGDLDFYLTRYRINGSLIDTNSFYLNNGDGTFTDITTMTGTNNGMKLSFCSTFFDYDNDGWDDLYVVNDKSPYANTLYHNNGDGTFTDVSVSSGTDIYIDAMNAGVGDYDHNGFLDIYVTNTGLAGMGLNYLFANAGDGTFTDMAVPSGTSLGRYTWGGNFFDYDHDLDLDLYVSCSQVGYDTPNAFLVNQGDSTFTEPFENTGGLQGKDTLRSYTNVIGDFNNDGMYDIAVCNAWGDTFQLWENTTVTSNHWFKLFLIGTHANRDAIGTWIEMWIDGEKYIQSLQSQEAYCGQNSKRLIMSTGTHTSIDSLVIKWPIKVGNVPYHKQVVPGSQIVMEAVDTITEPVICHTVTSPLNDGLGSLRAAVACANNGDTITVMLMPGDTIALTDEPLLINKDLVIRSGNGLEQPIQGPAGLSALMIETGKLVTLEALYLVGTGVIINNSGTLVLNSVSIDRVDGSTNPAIMNYGSATVQGQVQMTH